LTSRARSFEATLDLVDDVGFEPRDTIRLIEDACKPAAQHRGGQGVDRGPDRQRPLNAPSKAEPRPT
jgi:hypothetical protein